jgi:hypothetical protein
MFESKVIIPIMKIIFNIQIDVLILKIAVGIHFLIIKFQNTEFEI